MAEGIRLNCLDWGNPQWEIVFEDSKQTCVESLIYISATTHIRTYSAYESIHHPWILSFTPVQEAPDQLF